jgi:hypothetical protein
VLVDIALRVMRGEAIDLAMGYANVIWQGDANACAIASLKLCEVPPRILNVTGTTTLSIRAVALQLGQLLGRTPVFSGNERADALLSDSSTMRERLGAPSVSEDTLIHWVAEWISRGGSLLARPTHFEERDGRF